MRYFTSQRIRRWCLRAVLGAAVVIALWNGGSRGLSRREAPERLTVETHVAVPVADSHWPGLFGPRNDGTSAGASRRIPGWEADGPRAVWRVPCGSGYSSPVVWGDKLFLLHRLGDEEVVSCLQAATGAPLWEQRYPTAFVCGSHYTHGPYSTPTTDGVAVYTLGAEGRLHAWRLSDGHPLWSRDLRAEFAIPAEIFGVGHSPLCWNGRLFLNIGGTTPHSGIVALRTDTGETAWSATSAGAAYATPRVARIHGRDWLFVLTRQGLTLLDPVSGTEHWSYPFETRVPDAVNAVTPLVWEDLVLVSSWGVGTQVLRIQPDGTHQPVWNSRTKLTSQYTPLLAVEGCVIGVHATDNSLRCVELASGEPRWRWKSELGNCKNIRVGDQLILFGEYGHLGLLDANVNELAAGCVTARGVFADPSRCYSAPAYADGRLYLRNEFEVQCLELRAR